MEKAVYIDQAGNSYTRSKFIRYFEKKVMKTISKYRMIGKDDVVGVGLSGGKDSMTCLYIINKIQRERRRKVYAILVDEGIKGYRSSTIKDAKEFCKQHNIPLKIYKFSDVIGTTIDKVVRKENPCTTCGIFRRYVLNKAARDLKLDKIATGHNLDDEAQVLLMNQFKGNISFSAKLGPIAGVLSHEKFVPRIKPLYFCTEKEVLLYTKLMRFPVKFIECPNAKDSFRNIVGDYLNQLENQFPGTKQGIVNSFLAILPDLQKRYRNKLIGTCSICGEPAAKNVCRHCELMRKFKLIKY